MSISLIPSPATTTPSAVESLWTLVDEARPEGYPAGVATGLVVPPDTVATEGWFPATKLVDGSLLPALLDEPVRRWGAPPHAAAALSWKAYTYWLCLPAVLGYARLRRIPVWDADNTVVRLCEDVPYLMLGMRYPAVAVLESDPLAGQPGTMVVSSEAELLQMLRESVVDRHLEPLLRATRAQVRVGSRILWGALASSVAYAMTLAPNVDQIATAKVLLEALGTPDLVELVPGPDGATGVRRRTCCLAFTAPSLTICADCCIRR